MTILTTPDADAFRETVNGRRTYTGGVVGEANLRSVTSLKPEKIFKSRTPLGAFASLDAIRAAEWVAKNLDRLDEMEPDVLVDQIALAPVAALREAGDRGTRVHDAIAAKILGEPTLTLTEDEQAYVDAAFQFVADYGVEFIAVETICVIESLGAAGTIDWIGQAGSKLLLGDWKSRGGASRHGAYPEEAAQLGLYSLADRLVTGDYPGTKVAMPTVDELAVVSLRPDGSYSAFPVDIDGAQEAAKNMVGAFVHGQDLAETGTNAIGEPATGTAPPPPIDTMLGLRRSWLRARISVLTPEARTWAARTWPADVAKKAALMSHDDITVVAVCLDAAEAEYDLPFFSPDPRTPKAASGSASPRRARGKATNKKAS
jgi:hypothetical protein